MTRTFQSGSLGNRVAMWRAMRAPPARGFVSQPEPRSMGLYARGRQLVSGNFVFAGRVVEAPATAIWDLELDDVAAFDDVHGFTWLDDLAALGDAAARDRGQDWTFAWIARFGAGKGPGWTPDLTARRLIRWINHALFLLNGCEKANADAFYRSLSAQVVFLSRRWKFAAPGLPRFEALTGLIYAGLALTGMEARVLPAVSALAEDCAREVDALGGIPTRNPEELLDVFTLLTWAERALSETGHIPPPSLIEALERIALCLRVLRHADGGLARFHGGGRGAEGRLEYALAATGVRPARHASNALAMGFARLASARTSVIVDAASPPDARAGKGAHASTSAMELTSGRRPLIVNCGSGAAFGPDWRRAGRATASHSTLALDGYSSSRFRTGDEREMLVDRAAVSDVLQDHRPDGMQFSMTHDGWSVTHGLCHTRTLALSSDGRKLSGDDLLSATTATEQQRFEQVLTEGRMAGVGLTIRFHLHPDVDAQLDMGGSAVSLALKSGEIWVFRHDGQAKLTLDSSVYLDNTRLKPRPTRQIVLSARAMQVETRFGWTLAKAQDTPLAIRDLDGEDTPVQI